VAVAAARRRNAAAPASTSSSSSAATTRRMPGTGEWGGDGDPKPCSFGLDPAAAGRNDMPQGTARAPARSGLLHPRSSDSGAARGRAGADGELRLTLTVSRRVAR
jgi:hypothetical protein